MTLTSDVDGAGADAVLPVGGSWAGAPQSARIGVVDGRLQTVPHDQRAAVEQLQRQEGLGHMGRSLLKNVKSGSDDPCLATCKDYSSVKGCSTPIDTNFGSM